MIAKTTCEQNRTWGGFPVIKILLIFRNFFPGSPSSFGGFWAPYPPRGVPKTLTDFLFEFRRFMVKSVCRYLAQFLLYVRNSDPVLTSKIHWCVWLMLGRIVYCNNVSVEPWVRVRPRKGPAVATDQSPLFFVVLVVVVVVLCCWWCCLCYWRCLPFLVVVVGVLVVIPVPRSNNHNIYQNLWSVPFQTTPFVNPHNVSVIPCHRTHPPTRFYCPPHSKISKNGVFIHKQALFTDFRPFFARSWVKYQPILKRFSFPDSLQQALQHCRSKFVASQTSLHENNYRNFFRGESVSVR